MSNDSLDKKLLDIGDKIKFFRIRKGLTQQELGNQVGLNKSSARIRIAQYESGTRNPKQTILQAIADVLDVNILFLKAPFTYSEHEIMHMLFSLELTEEMEIEFINGIPYLRLVNSPRKCKMNLIQKCYKQWYDMRQLLKNGRITQERLR